MLCFGEGARPEDSPQPVVQAADCVLPTAVAPGLQACSAEEVEVEGVYLHLALVVFDLAHGPELPLVVGDVLP